MHLKHFNTPNKQFFSFSLGVSYVIDGATFKGHNSMSEAYLRVNH